MRFFGVETDTFEDAAAFDEISLGGCLAQTVNGDHFVLLCVVRTDTHQVVSLCLLEFNVSDVGLELESDAKALGIFFRIL